MSHPFSSFPIKTASSSVSSCCLACDLSQEQKTTSYNLVKLPPLFNFLPTISYCPSAQSITVKAAHPEAAILPKSEGTPKSWSLGCLRRQFQLDYSGHLTDSDFSVWMMISMQTRGLHPKCEQWVGVNWQREGSYMQARGARDWKQITTRMSTYSSYQCPYCGQSTWGLTINRPATTSFCPPAQPIRDKVEEQEVVLPLDGDNFSLINSECSSSLWAVTPMSCSTLSVSSEWESTDSVEGPTGKSWKEIATRKW